MMKAEASLPALILASASPQRRNILERLGLSFEVRPSDYDEDLGLGETLEETARLLAEGKAENVRDRPGVRRGENVGEPQAQQADRSANRDEPAAAPGAGAFILAADTIVGIDDTALGKPGDEQEARRMLEKLSGRTHTVYTGVALCRLPADGARPGLVDSEVAQTRVRFAPLSEREITYYLHSGEWHGAAGAYRIQGRAELFIEGVQGSYSNVVGLPIRLVYSMLQRSGYDIVAP
jgi:septum formation protein